MKLFAVVYTTNDDPDTPRLDQAWDGEVGELNPEGLRHGLGLTLMEASTHSAAVVVVEIPDEQLLPQLRRAAPLMRGAVIPE